MTLVAFLSSAFSIPNSLQILAIQLTMNKLSFNKITSICFFQLLFGIIITWVACAIMTRTGSFTDDPNGQNYRARTDVRSEVIHLTPWFYVPYPGTCLDIGI